MARKSNGGVTLTGEWDALHRALDPAQMRPRLSREVARAQQRVGKAYVREARRLIRAGAYAPNSPLTVILKGSTKPLVDKGELFQAITFTPDESGGLYLGLTKSSESQINLAWVLHEGATIDVGKHPKVRVKVWAMVRDKLGPARLAALNLARRRAVVRAARAIGAHPRSSPLTPAQRRAVFARLKARGGQTSKAKAVWVIPARPFLRKPAESTAFQRIVVDEYGAAIQRAFSEA